MVVGESTSSSDMAREVVGEPTPSSDDVAREDDCTQESNAWKLCTTGPARTGRVVLPMFEMKGRGTSGTSASDAPRHNKRRARPQTMGLAMCMV